MIEWCSKNKTIKIKENRAPPEVDARLSMLDLKLNARGIGEDETYALDDFALKNIRRGNTILEVSDINQLENEQTGEVTEERKVEKRIIGRKGLTKFFDLSIEYVDPKSRYECGSLPATNFCIKN